MSFFHHEGISEIFFKFACIRAASYQSTIPLDESQAATKAIAFDLLSWFKAPSDEWNPLAFKSLTNQLRTFSLLDYDTHSVSYSMHPLVQEWCRATAPNATTLRDCAAWVLSLCVKWEFDADSYTFRRRLLPHLLALNLDPSEMTPDLAQNLVLVYSGAGYTAEREALSAVALRGSRGTLGNEHLTTLICMRRLAAALKRRGKVEAAVALLIEGIDVMKKTLEVEHPDILSSLDDLAVIYCDQGRWKESESLFLEVIEARKRVIGEEHDHTLYSMGGLAMIYRQQGRLLEAEGLQIEVLEKTQRVRGRNHPNTLKLMHHLAMTYLQQGKLREAESLMEETVARRKQVLGESHNHTQNSAQELVAMRQRMRLELMPANVV